MTFTITYGCSLCGGIRKILNSASKLKFQQKCYARVENIHKKPFGLRIANAYYGTTAVTYGNTKVESISNEESSTQEQVIDPSPVLYIAKYNRVIDTSQVLNKSEDEVPEEDSKPIPERIDEKTDIYPSEVIPSMSKSDIIARAVKQTQSYEEFTKVLADEYNNRFKEDSITKQNKNRRKIADLNQTWVEDRLDPKELIKYYMMLSKSRLTALVAITSVAGYSMAPNIVFDPAILVTGTIGVALFSASANTLNQILEVPYDSQMNRTKNRVLVKNKLSTRHALAFAICTGVGGSLILGGCINSTAMYLGLANLVLYAGVYTPLKRATIANTWVGSIVGALPPLIGYASATGGTLDYGAGILAAILFSWQFPHFNSLSWNLRPDYSKAGYRMMSVTNPDLCKRVALRHSILCTGICSVAAPMLDVTTPTFAVISLPVNGILTYLAFKFYQESDSGSSRKLFRYTLIHLPMLLTLLYINKKEKSQKIENLSSNEITKEYVMNRGIK